MNLERFHRGDLMASDLGLTKGLEKGKVHSLQKSVREQKHAKYEARMMFGWRGCMLMWYIQLCEGREGNERTEAGEEVYKGTGRDAA